MSEAFTRVEVLAAFAIALCTGITIGGTITSLVILRRARKTLAEALQNRYGMDNNFVERLKREFPVLGGDRPPKSPHHH